MAEINNNNYVGKLTAGLSSQIQLGSNDMGMFHVDATAGNQTRFGYATTTAVLQDLSGKGGLCNLVDNGNGITDEIHLILKPVGVRLSECRGEFYETDYGMAAQGFLRQELNPELVQTFAESMIEDFSLDLSSLRWVGDTASTNPTLAYHDGIIKLIQTAGAWSLTNTTGYQKLPTTPPVTAGNVVEKIKEVINALPSKVTRSAGFKVIVGGNVSAALRSAAMQPLGVNNLTLSNPDLATGRLTDNFFSYAIYEVDGLNATDEGKDIILAGSFADSKKGVLKLGVNTPSDASNILIKELENDKVQFSLGAGQMVGVIPNLNQVAMNA